MEVWTIDGQYMDENQVLTNPTKDGCVDDIWMNPTKDGQTQPRKGWMMPAEIGM